MTSHVQEFLFLLCACLVAICTPAVVKESETPASPAETKIDVIWAVKIAMRDGVNLNATLYKPQNHNKPLPVIFTMTPYSSDEYHSRGMYFAQNGYVFAIVDCRGRGNSDGEFVPFVNEGRDGYDVAEWLARQTWSNGKIGMWGGSYSGYNQWITAGQFPPHLATIVPAASAYPGKNIPMVNNIHNQYWIQWFALVAGRTLNHYVSEDRTLWEQRFRELYFNHLPFEDLEHLAEISAPVF
jgi:putative CocE/NonD family hydrolase